MRFWASSGFQLNRNDGDNYDGDAKQNNHSSGRSCQNRVSACIRRNHFALQTVAGAGRNGSMPRI
jgi:hypothetical protein